MSCESPRTVSWVTPCSTAHCKTAIKPWYSATLLVAIPSEPCCSDNTVPASSTMCAPQPAGPGLPRAPPSKYAVIKVPGPGSRCLGCLRCLRCLRCDEVKNAVAAVALHDLFVLADFGKDRRTQPHLAHRAPLAFGAGHRAATHLGDALEGVD